MASEDEKRAVVEELDSTPLKVDEVKVLGSSSETCLFPREERM